MIFPVNKGNSSDLKPDTLSATFWQHVAAAAAAALLFSMVNGVSYAKKLHYFLQVLFHFSHYEWHLDCDVTGKASPHLLRRCLAHPLF